MTQTFAEALPVLTIGGYLGAGKTTLVNHLLRHADGRRLAVLVNEFGALPIDADLIEAQDDDLISIAGGCICCSFGNDLIGALNDLRAMDPPPDHVLIESSGVAIPGAIVSTLSLIDGLRSGGTVVVVDAETVRRAAQDDYIGDTILRQLRDAEIVVVNKSDLLPEDEAKSLSDWLSAQTRGAAQVPCAFGKTAPETILGAVADPGTGQPADHADRLFDSHILQFGAPTDALALAERLATGGFGVIRAKGFVTGADGQLWQLQTVGPRWEAEPATRDVAPGVVCLGLRGALDSAQLATLCPADTV